MTEADRRRRWDRKVRGHESPCRVLAKGDHQLREMPRWILLTSRAARPVIVLPEPVLPAPVTPVIVLPALVTPAPGKPSLPSSSPPSPPPGTSRISSGRTPIW